MAVRAFDSQDKEKIREAEAFIESVFEQVAQRRRDSGEPGILAQPNDRGASTLMSVAIGFCRQRQKRDDPQRGHSCLSCNPSDARFFKSAGEIEAVLSAFSFLGLRRTRRQRCMRLEDLIFLLVLDEIGCNSAHLVVGEYDRGCNSTRLVVDE